MNLTISVLCVSSLFMLTLLSRSARDTCLGPVTLSEPHWPSPHGGQCCDWADLCGSYCDHRMKLSEKPSGNFEEQDLLLTGPRGYTACQGPHSKSSGRDRETETWGSAFIRMWRWGAWGFMGSLINGSFEYKQKLGCGRVEAGSIKWSVIWVTQDFLKGEVLGCEWLVPYLVVLLVAVSYTWQYSRRVAFEMDSLAIKSLM